MPDLREAISLIIAHFRCAGYAAVVFTLGFISSVVVVKYRIEPLIVFPRWVTGKLHRLLKLNPPVMFLFIFGFNSTAICVYMLSGVIHYLVPVAIAFLTGKNIGVITFLAARTPPDEALESQPHRRLQILATACGILTALLEMPCFWIGIAMGMTLGGFGGGPGGDTSVAVVARLGAYLYVIVPVLLVSAIAETIGITLMMVRKDEEDK
ncbi:MAG: stage II sporulation protein M [Planctomycetes bacterium]|nr:stage II sporulation protein M [Planctomycetota bacterium]